MTSKKYILYFLILLISGYYSSSAIAENEKYNSRKVVWACRKIYTDENILWLVEWDKNSYIKVFDKRIPAKYLIEGIYKRWNWGLEIDEFTYNYSIILGPDKNAAYFDFRNSLDNTAKSKMFYECE